MAKLTAYFATVSWLAGKGHLRGVEGVGSALNGVIVRVENAVNTCVDHAAIDAPDASGYNLD